MTCKLNNTGLALAMVTSGIRTQKQLSEVSHVHAATLSRGISGARISVDTVYRLANALGCTPKDITELEESK